MHNQVLYWHQANTQLHANHFEIAALQPNYNEYSYKRNDPCNDRLV